MAENMEKKTPVAGSEMEAKTGAKAEATSETKAPTAHKAKAPATAAATPAKKGGAKEKINYTPNKPIKKKGTKTKWVKKEKVQKDAKTKDIQEALGEKWKPTFWGRFGKKNIRKQRLEKYNKWRKPRGIDILRERNDGELPNSGFRSPKALRGMHPSGFEEVLVHTKKDLDAMKSHQAARIASKIGRKKRIALVTHANSKKIWVLN